MKISSLCSLLPTLLLVAGAPSPAQEDAVDEVFLSGTAPVEVARPPDVADPNLFLMEEFDDGESASNEGTRQPREERVLGGMAAP